MRNSLPLILHDSAVRQERQMRKIISTDRFPCFACFDDVMIRQSCKECEGRGYVMGSHPMVQFAEDFIQKKMTFLRHKKQSLSVQSSQLTSVGIDNSKMGQIGLVSKCSVIQIQQQQQCQGVHSEYNCDYCLIKPIKGYRYHCQMCEDYDLCTKCYKLGQHEHQFIIIKPSIPSSMKQSIKSKKNIIENLRKSQKIK